MSAGLFQGSARESAEAMFRSLIPAVQDALIRVALWRGSCRESANGWHITSPGVVVERGGELRYLHEFDIQDMWPIVLAHSDRARLVARLSAPAAA